MRKTTLLGALVSAILWIGANPASAQEAPPPAPADDLAPTVHDHAAPDHAAPADAAPTLRDDAAAAPRGDRSRYRWHQGRWWYWLPSERWVFWSKDHWEDYLPPPPADDAPAQAALPAAPVARAGAPTVVYRYPASTYSYSYGYPATAFYYPSSRYSGYYGGGYPSVGFYFGGHGGHYYGHHGGHYGGGHHGGHGGGHHGGGHHGGGHHGGHGHH